MSGVVRMTATKSNQNADGRYATKAVHNRILGKHQGAEPDGGGQRSQQAGHADMLKPPRLLLPGENLHPVVAAECVR